MDRWQVTNLHVSSHPSSTWEAGQPWDCGLAAPTTRGRCLHFSMYLHQLCHLLFIDRAALLKYQVIFVDLIRPVTVKCLAVVVQQPSHHLVPCQAQATNICPLMFLVRSTADCLPVCIISALWVQPPLPMTVNMTIR